MLLNKIFPLRYKVDTSYTDFILLYYFFIVIIAGNITSILNNVNLTPYFIRFISAASCLTLKKQVLPYFNELCISLCIVHELMFI